MDFFKCTPQENETEAMCIDFLSLAYWQLNHDLIKFHVDGAWS